MPREGRRPGMAGASESKVQWGTLMGIRLKGWGQLRELPGEVNEDLLRPVDWWCAEAVLQTWFPITFMDGFLINIQAISLDWEPCRSSHPEAELGKGLLPAGQDSAPLLWRPLFVLLSFCCN
jgi:hypothetical protein